MNPDDPLSPQHLKTERTFLRPPHASDLPGLLTVLGNEKVAKYLPHLAWNGAEDAAKWLQKAESRLSLGSCITWAIKMKSGSATVGFLALFDFEENRTICRLGYVLGETHWGQGLVNECLKALLNHAFHDLGMLRIEAEIDPANTRSAAVLTRLGFALEGRLRDRRMSKSGDYVDSHIYGLLQRDWQANSEYRPGPTK